MLKISESGKAMNEKRVFDIHKYSNSWRFALSNVNGQFCIYFFNYRFFTHLKYDVLPKKIIAEQFWQNYRVYRHCKLTDLQNDYWKINNKFGIMYSIPIVFWYNQRKLKRLIKQARKLRKWQSYE
jgi:hypothetical protein